VSANNSWLDGPARWRQKRQIPGANAITFRPLTISFAIAGALTQDER